MACPMSRVSIVSLALIAALLTGCASTGERTDGSDLARLGEWMTGSFSSLAQSKADADYHAIRLHMARIWPERTDGYWLYVEQAVARAMDHPYRQRVYQVTHVGGDLYESRVFELPDPKARIGAHALAAPLADLSPADLVIREGAAIILRRAKNAFVGSTLGRQCLSDFGGATFATSEVEITPDRIVSWDRGFDAAGRQVWGAVKSGYIFDRE